MQYCIDYLYFDRGRLNVRGWAAPEEQGAETVVELVTEDGKRVEMITETTVRQDVNEYLYHKRSDDAYGFLMHGSLDTARAAWLHAYRKDAPEEEVKIELRKLYRHQNSLLSFIRSKDKQGFILRRKYGDLQPEDMRYNEWYQKHRAGKAELKAQRENHFTHEPLISVLVPVYNPKMDQFEAMVSSVRNQTYGNWQLCFANGCKENKVVSERLEVLQREEIRIKVIVLEKNDGISENTNACLKIADGEWIALLDQDDLYEPNALYEFVKSMNEHPKAELIYSDEDKIDDETGAHLTPHFKPDFSLARLHSDNYICHLIMIRTALARKVGGERKAYDGAQDFDFTLRCVENMSEDGEVVHISKILYNWRIHAASTSGGMQAKNYAVDAGARAIRDSYARAGHEVEMEPSKFSGRYITKPVLKEKPLVSILIPNKDHKDDLLRCVNSILERSTYENYEILLIENNSETEEIFTCYKELEARDSRIRTLYYKGSFNYAKINNFGAESAVGEYLLLLNNDTEVISPDFIESLVFYCSLPENGVVGAKLLYEDDTIQHAGVTAAVEGRVAHMYHGFSDEEPGYMGRLVSTCNVSAVTGACLMTTAELYREIGGMTEEFTVAYNDVDYCLKAEKAGKSVVYDAYAKLHHYESKSRGYEDSAKKRARLDKEMALLQERWAERLKRDPYYNDNLSMTRGFYLLP